MAQQVFGCKRRRLPEAASGLSRLLLIGAAAPDCPCTPTARTDATPLGLQLRIPRTFLMAQVRQVLAADWQNCGFGSCRSDTLLKLSLHQEDPERAATVGKGCRGAVPAGDACYCAAP